MGNSFSTFFDKLWQNDLKILMLGLDGAGKTTILKSLGVSDVKNVTIEGNVCEQVVYHNRVTITSWDLGGGDKLTPLKGYFPNTNAVIFVVDANDHARMSEAHDELYRLMWTDYLRGVPLLIFVNKLDFPDAMSTSEVYQRLELAKSQRGYKWNMQDLCATTKDGLYEGFEWIALNTR
ncbi:hypothetical protein FS749_007232 [Ceratobasidium sp. UAMH 11750]|nr:hypothetical protein FS749_007232 [Ceratobasidium sp. UAMH 11750]